MVLFFYVLQHLPVTVASASLYLVPVFGILIAAIFLGERLTPVAVAGTAVVLLSTIIIMKWDKSAV
jgi:drug/metabolite transporter (DMT)-like permease